MIKVGIFLMEKNHSFAVALSRGLGSEHCGMSFDVLETGDNLNQYDLIISDKLEDGVVDGAILLTDQRDEVSEEGGMSHVYRYEKSDRFVNLLKMEYFKRTGNNFVYCEQRKHRVVVSLSIMGGAGTTLITLGVIRMLYQIYGMRSLYVSLTAVNGSFFYLPQDSFESMDKLLYYLREGRNFPIEGFISTSMGIDFVSGGPVCRRISDLQGDMLGRLFDKVELLGKYDFVFLDVGNHIQRETVGIVENSDAVLMVGKKNMEVHRKWSLESLGFELPENKRIIEVMNFYGRWERINDDEDESSDGENVLYVSAYNNRKADLDQLIRSNFGTEMQSIAEKIMEAVNID